MEEPLTVEQEHLLKRELLRLQMTKESETIDNMINVDQLGRPFVLANGRVSSGSAYPLCSYILQNFVVTFPIVMKAKPTFWTESVQPFIQGLASKDISSSADRDESTKRRRAAKIIKRLLMLFFVAGIGSNRSKPPKPETTVVEEDSEEYKDEKDPNVEDIDLNKGEGAESDESPPPPRIWPGAYGAVIGVREMSSSGFIRNKTHSEYIIECFFNGAASPVYVARSWAEFVSLQKKITANFPGKRMPSLPYKTLSNTETTVNGVTTILLREQQRVTLREYIHKLCQIPRVANSDIFLDFLFKDKIELDDGLRKDIEARLALDRQRFEVKLRFRDLLKERERKLAVYVGEIKEQIMEGDALPQLFLELKTNKKVKDMTPLLQKAVEYCSVQTATILYDLFIGNDSGPDTFNSVRRLHNLMPYATIRGFLKLSNPALILKKLTDLFMATPFGKTSLIQQMFIRILSDDMVTQDKLIDDLVTRIPEKDIIKAMDSYIAEDHYNRIALQQRAQDDKIDLLLEVTKRYASRQTAKKVAEWHGHWQKAVKNQNGSEDEDPLVEKYSQLKDLMKLKIRSRDKDVMREFWADPQTIKFIREIVNLTYDVFIEIFKYANVAQSFYDFQIFMDDLLGYIESVTTRVVLDSSEMVDGLIGILVKHQNSVFKFINKVYSRDTGFFVDLVEWFTLFVSFVKRRKNDLNTVDLLGLVKNSKTADIKVVRKELDALQAWLNRRKETAKKAQKKATITGDGNDDFPTAAKLDVEDVGLSWEDIDFGLAEVEKDEMDEFLADPWTDKVRDQVVIERLRREKAAEIEARKAQLMPRPEMTETAKLRPTFETMMFEILSHAPLEKTRLKDISPTPLEIRKKKK